MTEYQINRFIDWLFVFQFFCGITIIAIIIMLVVSFAIYIKTGVHVKDWINKKFPS